MNVSYKIAGKMAHEFFGLMRMKTSSKIALALNTVLLTGLIASASAQSICDRLSGMMMASAIADAMAGPWEGRSTEKSEQFLLQGKWIDSFKDYNPWFQHHWNCYPRTAPAGMFTDDNRMRFSLAGFMIDHGKKSPGPMSREDLAGYIFLQYQQAYDEFLRWDQKYAQAETGEDSLRINTIRKEKFLAMWFGYELAKTATSVYVPSPPIKTPPYVRVDEKADDPENPPEWHLEPNEISVITGDIKEQYHHNTYQHGQEMPLGLIHLLPVAAWFGGKPAQAFDYVLEIDFFDIGEAPYYPATAVALLAELLGGKKWSELSDSLLAGGLRSFVEFKNTDVLKELNDGLSAAISIARKHKFGEEPDKEKTREFVFALHREFGTNEQLMCSVEEMLFVAVALMEYGQSDINYLIELGVNYGRDNDTVASIAAAFGGAAHGLSALNPDHIETIEAANRDYEFDKFLSDFCSLVVN